MYNLIDLEYGFKVSPFCEKLMSNCKLGERLCSSSRSCMERSLRGPADFVNACTSTVECESSCQFDMQKQTEGYGKKCLLVTTWLSRAMSLCCWRIVQDKFLAVQPSSSTRAPLHAKALFPLGKKGAISNTLAGPAPWHVLYSEPCPGSLGCCCLSQTKIVPESSLTSLSGHGLQPLPWLILFVSAGTTWESLTEKHWAS